MYITWCMPYYAARAVDVMHALNRSGTFTRKKLCWKVENHEGLVLFNSMFPTQNYVLISLLWNFAFQFRILCWENRIEQNKAHAVLIFPTQFSYSDWTWFYSSSIASPDVDIYVDHTCDWSGEGSRTVPCFCGHSDTSVRNNISAQEVDGHMITELEMTWRLEGCNEKCPWTCHSCWEVQMEIDDQQCYKTYSPQVIIVELITVVRKGLTVQVGCCSCMLSIDQSGSHTE